MKRKLRVLFLAVEVNLLLWLAVCGMAFADAHKTGGAWWRGGVEVNATLLLVGFGFALIFQHWAFHSIRREADRQAP